MEVVANRLCEPLVFQIVPAVRGFGVESAHLVLNGSLLPVPPLPKVFYWGLLRAQTGGSDTTGQSHTLEDASRGWETHIVHCSGLENGIIGDVEVHELQAAPQ